MYIFDIITITNDLSMAMSGGMNYDYIFNKEKLNECNYLNTQLKICFIV
tara:strand:+ start:2809 stop:2955 length:147 start_codon:yes stop_codon:yes gene_type:complete